MFLCIILNFYSKKNILLRLFNELKILQILFIKQLVVSGVFVVNRIASQRVNRSLTIAEFCKFDS
jgi:hypothetical protein